MNKEVKSLLITFISIFIGASIGLLCKKYNITDFVVFNIQDLQKIGILFICLIKMITIPMIFLSIISSFLYQKQQINNFKLITFSFFIFIFMTLICVLIGQISGIILGPGYNITFDKNQIMNDSANATSLMLSSAKNIGNIKDFIFSCMPTNILEPILHGNMLQVMVLSCILGIGAKKLSITSQSKMKEFLSIFIDLLHIIAKNIMKCSSVIIFCTITWLFAVQNLTTIYTLSKLIFVMLINSIFIIYFLYSLILFSLKLSPIKFIIKMTKIQIMTFINSSSSSFIPALMKLSKEKFGMSDTGADFVIPLSASMDKNGSGLYLSLTTIFLAQLFAIDLTLNQHIFIFLMSSLCAICTPSVPAASLLLLGNIITPIGIPIEAIGIILIIDRFLDMIRSVINITGDAIAAIIIDSHFKLLNKNSFNS